MNPTDINPLLDDFKDLFEQSRNGYLITDPKGFIIRCNATLANWTGIPIENINGIKFSDLLTIGGKIYYETHLWPLLRLQGFFDEVALELADRSGNKWKVNVNGHERRNEHNEPLFISLTVFKANDRFLYEQHLREAKLIAENNLANEKGLSLLREQFIAVLGHDLRNPLASIMMGASLLQTAGLQEPFVKVLSTVKNSAIRMQELISNVMDFARSRMGDGISLQLQPGNPSAILEHVVAELQSAFPTRLILTNFNITNDIVCDPARLSQLLSNLVANALTHGAADTPVYVNAGLSQNMFELTVINSGLPIPPAALDRLFEPFTRESAKPSQHGLGLGLFITAEIARAHNGVLTVISTEAETRFTFRMNINTGATSS